MLGLIAFLSTTVFFSPVLNLLLLPIAFYRMLLSCRQGWDISFLKVEHILGALLLFLSAILSVVVFLLVDPVVENFEKSLLGAFPHVLLILVSLFIGLVFRKQDLIIVLVLVFVEIALGAAEYIAGTHSFFAIDFKGQTQVGDTDLLYYNRVFGLSVNSSAYAFKVLVGFVILMAIKSELSRRVLLLCIAVLVVGFVTSFNRTAIVAVGIGFLVLYCNNWRVLLASFTSGCVVCVYYLSSLIDNFNRGKDGVDLSGRDYIFNEFLTLLMQRPFLGNATRKVWLQIDGNLYHAHNSYLEFMASNGIFISLLFFTGYYLLVLRGRLLIALPLLVYSVFQYGLLWGLVFHDVVFFGLMFYLLKSEYGIQTSPVQEAVVICPVS
jgi:hypothetical protein